MADQATVGQRFVQLIAHLGISKNAFANSLDKTATVVQHLVEERNKPGFDLLCKVFEVYPNVSKDWLLEGAGPMLLTDILVPAAPLPADAVAAVSAHTSSPAALAPANVPEAAAKSSAEFAAKAAPAVAIPAPVSQPAPVSAAEAPSAGAPMLPAQTAAPVAAHAAVAPVAAPVPAVAPDAAWQTALYTQQMAHQLAMAELRNQHLQDQQRLMQQMLDLMQRKL